MSKLGPEHNLFTTEYARLNPEQKRAVDTVDGPVMVLAGPGTGKTQILSLRIANIVRTTDTPADAILALTFTESAASNMRNRLVRMMGSSAYEVHIHTFHGLASTLIGRYPEYFPRILGAALATDVDKLRIVESILRAHQGQHIRWYDNYTGYVTGLLSAIDTLKREYISPALLAQHITDAIKDFDNIPDKIHEKGQYKGQMKSNYKELQKQIEKNAELVQLYEAFDDMMRESKLYDFTDMLIEVVRVCEENPEFLLMLQEEYQYILVDEHQDSNNLQNRMIELLGSFHESPNIFVVGDDKQSVYRFQGASPDYFHGFAQKYPNANVISLVSNYRSSQSVLDIAHALLPTDTVLEARSVHASTQALSTIHTTEEAELFAIVQQILQLISEGVAPEEIAVLTRTNSDSGACAQVFDTHAVPYIVESDIDIMDMPFIRAFLALLKTVYNPHDEVSLTEALYAPWSKLDTVDVARIIHTGSKKRKKTLFDILCDTNELSEIGVKKPKQFTVYAEKIQEFHKKSYSDTLVDLFSAISASESVIESIPGNSLQATLGLVQVLYDDVQTFASGKPRATLRDYIEYLITLDEHGKKIKQTNRGGRAGYVRIMTAHKSKGLEFDHVFIPKLVNKKWGNTPDRNPIKILERVFDGIPNNNSNADERRLLYVALTRARKQLHLSYAERSLDGREFTPSVFWSDVVTDVHALEQDPRIWEADFESNRLKALMHTDSKTTNTREEFHEYVMHLMESRPIAATHLNNYVADPWEYIFKNLIRVPELQSSPMMYGTAIHKALEMGYKLVQNGEPVNAKTLIDAFGDSLSRQPLSEADCARLLHQGSQTLTQWYDRFGEALLPMRGMSEYAMSGVIMGSSGIVLTGKLDRFEFVEGSDVRVRVIDFKTGKPKSRNDIMGKTKSSDGNYYRQLQFYALLLRYFHDGQYTAEDLVLHFVEPNDSGKFVTEHFQIPEEEVNELELIIEDMVASLKNGEYWDREPDHQKCNFVELVQKMRNS